MVSLLQARAEVGRRLVEVRHQSISLLHLRPLVADGANEAERVRIAAATCHLAAAEAVALSKLSLESVRQPIELHLGVAESAENAAVAANTRSQESRDLCRASNDVDTATQQRIITEQAESVAQNAAEICLLLYLNLTGRIFPRLQAILQADGHGAQLPEAIESKRDRLESKRDRLGSVEETNAQTTAGEEQDVVYELIEILSPSIDGDNQPTVDPEAMDLGPSFGSSIEVFNKLQNFLVCFTHHQCLVTVLLIGLDVKPLNRLRNQALC